VSRQTLHRAVAAADRAAVEALSGKRRGRKPEPATRKQVKELTEQNRRLTRDLEHMSTRYEVAKTLLELQRKTERGERLPGEKKNPSPAADPSPLRAGPERPTGGMAGRDGGRGSGGDGTGS
jgi:hypothetical protein